ncbi:MAG: hypothetical protein ACQ9ET_00025 [Nitrosomonadaceae bacterium]
MIAWKDVIAGVMNQVNALFFAFTTAKVDQTNITGQKIYLEKYLNDTYDPVLKRIFIGNVEKAGFEFLRNKVEQRPPFTLFNKAEGGAKKYLNNKSELFGDFEYIINIPVSVTFVENVLRDQVNFYNPAGRRYDIVTF